MSSTTPRGHERPGRGGSLAFLLTAWYTSATLLVLATVTALLYYALADNLVRKISEQSLTDEVEVCQALVREQGGESHALHEEVEIDSAVRRYQRFYVRVLDPNGVALSTTLGMNESLSARSDGRVLQQNIAASFGSIRLRARRIAP